jgi:hypothetical protein
VEAGEVKISFPEDHVPEVVYFDEWHVRTPAEVCAGCSDPLHGIWVPVSFCDLAARRLQ